MDGTQMPILVERTTSNTTSSDFRTARPAQGRGEAALRISDRNFRAEREEVLHRYTTSDAMILEQMMTGTVIGSLLGLAVTGAASASAILHVFEFRNGLISHENVWLDSTAIVDQLSRR